MTVFGYFIFNTNIIGSTCFFPSLFQVVADSVKSVKGNITISDTRYTSNDSLFVINIWSEFFLHALWNLKNN